jgi:7-cyano-7-deazaguanine reductase
LKNKLNILKNKNVKYPDSPEKAVLEKFKNQVKKRDYVIRFNIPEFTSLCPITGQPDFGNLIIDYVPDKLCVESKSLKLFIFSFRNHGAFHESVTNQILDRIYDCIKPKWIRITALFYRRGGISIDVFAEHGKLPKNVNLPKIPNGFEQGRYL